MNRPLQHISQGVCVSASLPATCRDGGREEQRLVCVAEETPIAFRYNGFAYAVMMATPDDLEDFAIGFSVSEGIIAATAELPDVSLLSCGDGITIEMSLRGEDLHRYLSTRRIRRLQGHTSCGLCGVEDLDDVSRPHARVRPAAPLNADAIAAALTALRQWQPLSRQTRGAHAAAWVGHDGELQLVREDVGRHNALDKLIGAMVRRRSAVDAGFCLITSRCSFEMVQKAVAAGFPSLVSAGAPTTTAIGLANAAGLMLYTIARDGRPLMFAPPQYSEMTHDEST
jgi:FdhD protein